MISIQQLSYAYGERQALNAISLQIQSGKIFGLVGPNGSGKTTLFKILSTLLVIPAKHAPDRDRGAWIQDASKMDSRFRGNDITDIHILGVSLSKNPDKIRNLIGVVFQAPSLDKKLSIYENIKYQGYLYGMEGDQLRQRADDLLKKLGLLERKKDRVETLSGGLIRRCEIAKALLHQPKILLMDEPTTGLDPGIRAEIWNYLKVLQKTEGVTTVVSTHLMEEAEKCDELAILHEGRVVAQGTAEALKHSISGDLLSLKTSDPQRLKNYIQEKYGIQNVMLLGEWVRVEHPSVKKIMFDLSSSPPLPIEVMTIAKPTLEDVFLRKTGCSFLEGKS